MRSKLLVRVAVTGLLGLAALAAVSAPASAVPGLVRTTNTTAFDSTQTKEALAQCPAGTRVLGGGGSISGSAGNVHFIRLQALGSSDRFAAAAMENGIFTGNWSVTAYAICGAQPAGLVYVANQTVTDSDGHKTETVECPDGTTAISYGARVIGGDGDVVIAAVGPKVGLNGTDVTADEDEGGTLGNWNLWAHAVCANPLPGQELVWANALPADSSSPKTVTVACPTSKRVHGTGSVIVPSFGEVFHTAITPNPGLTAVAATAIEDRNGAAHDWWSRVYAVCAF